VQMNICNGHAFGAYQQACFTWQYSAILNHTQCQTHLSQDQPPKFLFNASNPLKCNKLLVDEASMLDLPLAAALLDAVPHHPNLQLVLVGVCCSCFTLYGAASELHVSVLQDIANLQNDMPMAPGWS
jgi:hypothetical protein